MLKITIEYLKIINIFYQYTQIHYNQSSSFYYHTSPLFFMAQIKIITNNFASGIPIKCFSCDRPPTSGQSQTTNIWPITDNQPLANQRPPISGQSQTTNIWPITNHQHLANHRPPTSGQSQTTYIWPITDNLHLANLTVTDCNVEAAASLGRWKVKGKVGRKVHKAIYQSFVKQILF